MISESAISKECMSKTLARARNVAKNGGFVYSRSVDYEPDVTIIRACVESSSWNDYPYDVHVELDEVTGTIMDYECTCPAHYRYPGMCKHSAALVLLYNNEPETFRGYAPVRATTTSRSISALMRRLAARNSAPAAVQGDQPAGSVYLQLIFEASRLDRWNASFKICSAQASYVLKDIQEFLDRVEANSYYEYGKKLGFTHAQDMFTEQGWAVVEWLRATTSASTGWWHQYEWQSGGTKRYIFLSPAQVIALLDLYQGQQVLFEGEDILGKARTMRVVRHDPKLSVAIKPHEDGAYEIRIGASSRDIRLTAKVELTGAKPLPVRVTADTTIGDLMRIPGADKLMAKVMGAMGGAFGGGDTPDLGEGADAMMAAMIEGTPLHSCKSFTGGAFTDEMMNGLIDALNEMQK